MLPHCFVKGVSKSCALMACLNICIRQRNAVKVYESLEIKCLKAFKMCEAFYDNVNMSCTELSAVSVDILNIIYIKTLSGIGNDK